MIPSATDLYRKIRNIKNGLPEDYEPAENAQFEIDEAKADAATFLPQAFYPRSFQNNWNRDRELSQMMPADFGTNKYDDISALEDVIAGNRSVEDVRAEGQGA
jgi:hypothetical protein